MADTDNKVDEATFDVDAPKLKTEVEEIIEREEAAPVEEEPTITSGTEVSQPEPDDVPSTEELRQRLDSLESRYAASSAEGKRLAEELKLAKQREEYLQQRWNVDAIGNTQRVPTFGNEYRSDTAPENAM